MNFKNFDLSSIIGFEWDKGNVDKNKKKHKLDKWEIEEVFFNLPIIILEDQKHSTHENRWFALGKTDSDIKLIIVFTLRNNLLRVISARKMNKKEKTQYENI